MGDLRVGRSITVPSPPLLDPDSDPAPPDLEPNEDLNDDDMLKVKDDDVGICMSSPPPPLLRLAMSLKPLPPATAAAAASGIWLTVHVESGLVIMPFRKGDIDAVVLHAPFDTTTAFAPSCSVV